MPATFASPFHPTRFARINGAGRGAAIVRTFLKPRPSAIRRSGVRRRCEGSARARPDIQHPHRRVSRLANDDFGQHARGRIAQGHNVFHEMTETLRAVRFAIGIASRPPDQDDFFQSQPSRHHFGARVSEMQPGYAGLAEIATADMLDDRGEVARLRDVGDLGEFGDHDADAGGG